MYLNGIVIQKYVGSKYKGIDSSGLISGTGENWYFNYDGELASIFEPYYDEYIERANYFMPEHSWVAACTDIEYIKKYIEKSEKRNIKYRLLLCETNIPEPIMNDEGWKREFLGYDYAYASGDYYSAVYNEIPSVFPQFELNENGLFETETGIAKFIAARKEFEKTNPPLTLEVGDFVIFRLSELYI